MTGATDVLRRRPLPELLAPGGSFACAEAALLHGADAVYAGVGELNLRARAPNLSVEELADLLELAREAGGKVYTVLNSMPDEQGLAAVGQLLTDLTAAHIRPHAFIVSDPGVISLCRQMCPDTPLHLSTQTGTFNGESLRFWRRQGVTRVILPRELTLAQVKALSEQMICDIEVFVHGAMCVSVSGRCLLSAYLSGRHANFGDCPQPCRLRYRIMPEMPDENAEWFGAEEDHVGVYLLNSKDLNTLDILPRIAEAGVSSVKIEGRNKSVHYVSAVTKVYREALDACAQGDAYHVRPEWRKELDLLDHRPYTTGFYDGEYALQAPMRSKADTRIRVVGMVKERLDDGRVVVDVKNPFTAGERLNVLPAAAGKPPFEVVIEDIADLHGNPVERALTNRIVRVKTSVPLRRAAILRRML